MQLFDQYKQWREPDQIQKATGFPMRIFDMICAIIPNFSTSQPQNREHSEASLRDKKVYL